MNFFAQVLGLYGLVFLMISIQKKTKKEFLKFEAFENVFYYFQYLSLNAASGAATSLLSVIRNIILNRYEKRNRKVPEFFLLIFIIILVIVSCFVYNQWYSIIPVLATLLYTYSVWQDSPRTFKMITVAIGIAWITYDIMVGAYIAVLGSIIEIFVVFRFPEKFKLHRR